MEQILCQGLSRFSSGSDSSSVFVQYEKLSELSEDDVGIEEIADPRRLEREDDIR